MYEWTSTKKSIMKVGDVWISFFDIEAVTQASDGILRFHMASGHTVDAFVGEKSMDKTVNEMFKRMRE